MTLVVKPETNELSKNAMGGTELLMKRLYDTLPANLLEQFQIIPSRVTKLNHDKKKIYYLHDLAGDPAVRHLMQINERLKYDLLVFVSNWQMQSYKDFLNVPYSAGIVMENSIVPFAADAHQTKPNTEELHVIYTPTPHRGLEILVPVFIELAKIFPHIVLDVYSSFRLYGWDERDAQYADLFKSMDEHPRINNYGTVSNDKIREALTQSHIFAYPSIWQETSCLCLIEAMSAGVLCVHPNLAALPETAGGSTIMYQYNEDLNVHANQFAQVLKTAIENYDSDYVKNRLWFQKITADTRFNWNQRSQQWQGLLTSMLG